MIASTWRVGGCVQGDRRHAGVARDRVLMRMLMVRMSERVGLLVRGVIGVKWFVACHQRVQHVEHHLRRCSGAATRRLTEWIRMIVPVRADDYGRRLPRRPRRLDARDARRDVPLMIPLPLLLLLPGAARSSSRTYSRRCTRAFVQPPPLWHRLAWSCPEKNTGTTTSPWEDQQALRIDRSRCPAYADVSTLFPKRTIDLARSRLYA